MSLTIEWPVNLPSISVTVRVLERALGRFSSCVHACRGLTTL